MTQTIDLNVMARFLVLPGAVDLLEAFSRIPPGKLRQTAIDHVAAIGEAFETAPQPMHVDPLLTAGVINGDEADVASLLSGPRRGTVQTDDPDVKAVELMLRGTPPHMAAKQLGIHVNQVLAAKKAAKKHGLNFPPLRTRNTKALALFVTDMEQLTNGYAISVMTRAAEARGLDLEGYLERRKLGLTMAMEGRHIRAIMEATKEPRSVLTTWFTSARRAGYEVPYMIDVETPVEPAPAPEPVVEVAPIPVQPAKRKTKRSQGRFLLFATEMRPGNVRLTEKAAAAMGLTVAQYFEVRRKALGMYQKGALPSHVAHELRITSKQAQNWRERAIMAGVLKRRLDPPMAAE